MRPARLNFIRCSRQLAIVTALAVLVAGCGFAESFCGNDPYSCEAQVNYD